MPSLSRLLLAAALVCGSATASSAQALTPSRTITITVNDDMKFSVTEITAKPGDVIRVRLLAIGTAMKTAMSHNFILLKSGTNQIAFAEAAAKSVGTDYIPPAMKSSIVASTALVANGESADVTFKVPAQPGNYPFLCSFPGHFAAGARGKLIVK